MSCLVLEVWARGWNSRVAEECQNALEEIRHGSDRDALARSLIDYSFIQFCSSQYREGHRSAAEILTILTGGSERNPYLSLVFQRSDSVLPHLLFLGEWGEALREIKAAIRIMDKNEDHSRGTALRLYEAWTHFQALDFAGALAICEALLPLFTGRPWVSHSRFCLILIGSTETALGHYDRAAEDLQRVQDDSEREMVIFDWYRRMLLESALTDLWLAKGEVARARVQVERFLDVTLATAERTWQALAWDANARVAMAERDLKRVQECLDEAVSRNGWLRGPAGRLARSRHRGRSSRTHRQATHHRLSRVTILQLANSLSPDEPLRATFLAAPAVRQILGNA